MEENKLPMKKAIFVHNINDCVKLICENSIHNDSHKYYSYEYIINGGSWFKWIN